MGPSLGDLIAARSVATLSAPILKGIGANRESMGEGPDLARETPRNHQRSRAMGVADEDGRAHVVLPVTVQRSDNVPGGFGFSTNIFGAKNIRYLTVQILSTADSHLEWSVEIKNPPIGVEFVELHLFSDLIFQLRQQSGKPQDGFDLLRFVLSAEAEPGSQVGLELSELHLVSPVNLKEPSSFLTIDSKVIREAIERFEPYFSLGSYRESRKRAQKCLSAKRMFLASGTEQGFDPSEVFSEGVVGGLNRTDKSQLFALLPIADLAIEGLSNDSQLLEAASVAKLLWEQWLAYWSVEDRTSLDSMVWYDHSVPERLITQVFLYLLLHETNCDEADLHRLQREIEAHVWLLLGEGLYTRNQPDRWHNHGLFQDISLLVVATLVAVTPIAELLRKKVNYRVDLYVEHAVVFEDGFAGSVEGATGYHLGIQRILKVIGSELPESRCSEAAEGMEKLTKILTYPDGRMPAIGDTHFSTPKSPRPTVRPLEPLAKHLPKIGFTVIRGGPLGGDSMMLINSGQNSITHRHDDLFSFVLFAGGVEWITDGGYSSHLDSDEVGLALRSARAHNIPFVKNQCYDARASRHECTFQSNSEQVRFFGRHSAWGDITLAREIIVNHLGANVQITDTVEKSGRLKRSQTYAGLTLGPGVTVEKMGSRNSLYLWHPASTQRLVLSWPEIGRAFNMRRKAIQEKVARVAFSAVDFADVVRLEFYIYGKNAILRLSWDTAHKDGGGERVGDI